MAQCRGSKDNIEPIDLSGVETYSTIDRKDLVASRQFGRPTAPEDGMDAFLEGLPDVLAVRSLREVAAAICRAAKDRRPVVFAFGAHVIKCGLNPFIIDLMRSGYVNALSLNGAGAIHDYEIALKGATSEDVAEALRNGSFGMARETADAMGRAAADGARDDLGLGSAVGGLINSEKLPNADSSVLAFAQREGIPASVHVAIGTDIVHMHPNVSAADMGAASHIDFRKICSVVSRLQGGVWCNIGSAVILPEVFLKALTVARNLGHEVNDFTTVNMDMLRHYRPSENVLRRPGGTAHNITGHHEIMIPLLRMAILLESGKS